MNRAELRAVARLARRTARHEWRRSLLIGLLVAVPVMVAVSAAGAMRWSELTPEEHVTARMGAADLQLRLFDQGPGTPEDAGTVLADLVAGTDAEHRVPYRQSTIDLGADRMSPLATDLPVGHPVTAGMYEVVEGRAPEEPGEVAVTVALRDRGLAVGDQLDDDSDLPGAEVVGVLVDPTAIRSLAVQMTPADLDVVLSERDHSAVAASWLVAGMADASRAAFEVESAFYERMHPGEGDRTDMVDPGGDEWAGPVGEETAHLDVQERRQELQEQATLNSGLDRAMTPQVVGTLVAAVLLAEVALIAGAAYATGARRRLRELGLLGAGGATTAHLRSIVVGEAAVTGVVGAAVGAAAGVVVLAVGQPWFQLLLSPVITGLELSTSDLVGPAIAGVVAVTLAAWLPARTAARVPTTTALQGRMPLSSPRRWIVPVGIILTGFGLLLLVVGILAGGSLASAVAVIGVLFAIAGSALLTIPIVALLGRVADRFPAVLRLVARDSGRQRTRAAAASASAMVVLLAPVLIGTVIHTEAVINNVSGLPQPTNHVMLRSDEQVAHDQQFWGESPDAPATEQRSRADVVADVSRALPEHVHAEVTILAAAAALPPAPPFVEGDVPDVGYERPPEMTAQPWFEPIAGQARFAVATDDLLMTLGDADVATTIEAGNPAILGVTDREVALDLDGQQVTATEHPVPVLQEDFPRVLLPEALVDELGIEVAGVADLWVTATPLDDDTRAALYETDAGARGLSVGWSGPDGEQARWIAMGAALVVSLVILALVTMLSATESDRDLRTMVAVGAAPRMRRRFLGLQSAVHALVGAALAVPLALLLARSVMSSGGSSRIGVFGASPSGTLWIDWQAVGLALVVVPVVIGIVIALLVRSAPTVPPRRVG